MSTTFNLPNCMPFKTALLVKSLLAILLHRKKITALFFDVKIYHDNTT